jgi:hypothetical protein
MLIRGNHVPAAVSCGDRISGTGQTGTTVTVERFTVQHRDGRAYGYILHTAIRQDGATAEDPMTDCFGLGWISAAGLIDHLTRYMDSTERDMRASAAFLEVTRTS